MSGYALLLKVDFLAKSLNATQTDAVLRHNYRGSLLLQDEVKMNSQ
jgi:hypothetical protein